MPATRIFFQLIADFVVYLGLLIRRRKALAAENLFLRRQLALYQERKVGPAANQSRDAHYVGSALKVIQLARCAHCGSAEKKSGTPNSGLEKRDRQRGPPFLKLGGRISDGILRRDYPRQGLRGTSGTTQHSIRSRSAVQ